MSFKPVHQLLVITILLFLSSCITQFIPDTSEDPDLLVVEGLITDQPGVNTIRLTKSLPLGGEIDARPLTGCNVNITDDIGNNFHLNDAGSGTYQTDPSNFRGVIGRTYILHIAYQNRNYQSLPMHMNPVPPIDSVYYEKEVITAGTEDQQAEDGCQIYLDSHDSGNNCNYYRWEFEETWEVRLPFATPNNRCWVTGNSVSINIKNTSTLAEDKIIKYPLYFISNSSDRLRGFYSILVRQYSLSEDEYMYWEKMQSISQNVGSLYDMTPNSISSNIWCVDNPGEKVLGYFSVSAATSKRRFIRDNFSGTLNNYTSDICVDDTIFGRDPLPPEIGKYIWIIAVASVPPPGYKVLTRNYGCYDCTVRGTNIKPDFWIEDRK